MPKKIKSIGADSVTTKAIKANLNSMSFDEDGALIRADFQITFHEPNDAPVVPTGNQQQQNSVKPYMDSFVAREKYINPTSRLYVLPDAVGAVSVKDYFDTKHLNSYSVSVNASSDTSKVIEATAGDSGNKKSKWGIPFNLKAMHTVQNKKSVIKGMPTCYGELIKMCLDSTPPQGINTSEIAKRLKVHAKITDKATKFQFEDAEMDTIRECISITQWRIVDQFIVDFEKDLSVK